MAQCENVLSIDRNQLDLEAGPIGVLNERALRDVVKAIGYVIESDCEPQAWTVVLLASAILPTGCIAVENMAGITGMRELQSTGDPADAEILRVWDTGMTLNDDPVIGME